MLSEQDARDSIGTTAYSSDGDKLGKVGQLFLDDETGNPEFITVNTGLFGNNESFIPVQDASREGDRLTLPFSKAKVKDAPNVDTEDGHLDRADEQVLYEYYGKSYGSSDTSGNLGRTDTHAEHDLNDGQDHSGHDHGDVDDRSTTGLGTTGTGTSGTSTWGPDHDVNDGGDHTGHDHGDVNDHGTAGHDTSGPTTDDAMPRSEEKLHVDTAREETGRARLRKYVTTEEQTVTVPVKKEKAVLVTEPITDGNVGNATGGPDISEEEHEVTLSEERVQVSKTTEPVERVRLGTETVTEEQTVTEEVRKEHIETDGDVDDRS